MTVDLILAPQGAEYTSIVRGLNHQALELVDGSRASGPIVCPLPIGAHALPYLQRSAHIKWRSQETDWHGKTVILMGLGGSLSPQYDIGDIVIPNAVSGPISSLSPSTDMAYTRNGPTAQPSKPLRYDIAPALVDTLYQNLSRWVAQRSNSTKVGIVHGLTSDRIIATPKEKQYLAKTYDAELVEMEGAYLLNFLQQQGAHVAMVRVISDSYEQEMPDLNRAIDPNGNLKFGSMLGQFLRQPIAAAHLIRGSLKGLKCLELIAACCAYL